MGGSVYLIYGRPDELLLSRQPRKRNLFDRLLSRQRYSEPKTYEIGDTIHWELDSEKFQSIYKEFIFYLESRLKNPNESSVLILDYLKGQMIDVYLRGETAKFSGEKTWYIQISFSGCAGEAEVTAELCAHWAELWLEDERDRIFSEILEPAGFYPVTENEKKNTFPPFCPTEYGYAIYYANLEDYQQYHFEIDPCFLEDGDADDTLADIQNKHLDAMKSNHCQCQLCNDLK